MNERVRSRLRHSSDEWKEFKNELAVSFPSLFPPRVAIVAKRRCLRSFFPNATYELCDAERGPALSLIARDGPIGDFPRLVEIDHQRGHA